MLHIWFNCWNVTICCRIWRDALRLGNNVFSLSAGCNLIMSCQEWHLPRRHFIFKAASCQLFAIFSDFEPVNTPEGCSPVLSEQAGKRDQATVCLHSSRKLFFFKRFINYIRKKVKFCVSRKRINTTNMHRQHSCHNILCHSQQRLQISFFNGGAGDKPVFIQLYLSVQTFPYLIKLDLIYI